MENIFYGGKPVLITVVGGVTGDTVYVNGKKAEASSHLGLTQQDLSGRLILGTSPVVDEPWPGEVMGIAIYASELSLSQVMAHCRSWMQSRQIELAHEQNTVAVYDFHEGSGQIIHNLANGAANLTIPSQYSVPYKIFLERP